MCPGYSHKHNNAVERNSFRQQQQGTNVVAVVGSRSHRLMMVLVLMRRRSSIKMRNRRRTPPYRHLLLAVLARAHCRIPGLPEDHHPLEGSFQRHLRVLETAFVQKLVVIFVDWDRDDPCLPQETVMRLRGPRRSAAFRLCPLSCEQIPSFPLLLVLMLCTF